MGLHQAIVEPWLSFPCDCGADDDHNLSDGTFVAVEEPLDESEPQ